MVQPSRFSLGLISVLHPSSDAPSRPAHCGRFQDNGELCSEVPRGESGRVFLQGHGVGARFRSDDSQHRHVQQKHQGEQ